MGSTGHFLTDTLPSQAIQTSLQPINIFMPNGDTIQSSESTQLNITSLDPTAQPAYVCPNLQPHSLRSIGQLCDTGCEAIFTANQVTIALDNKPILNGLRNPITNLWHLPVPIQTQTNDKVAHSANTVIHPTSPAMLVAFAHVALFSPTLTTLQKALDKNFLVDILGLTSHTLRAHPPSSASTIKGHLDQIRQNINPTPTKQQEYLTLPTSTDDCNQPTQADHAHQCFVSLHQMTKTTQGEVYTNQTGKFSVTSSKGNSYVLILYDYDSNSIHAHPLKTKTATEMVDVYTQLYNTLIAAGLRPKLHRLDNECSALLKQFTTTENVTVQLVPPGNSPSKFR